MRRSAFALFLLVGCSQCEEPNPNPELLLSDNGTQVVFSTGEPQLRLTHPSGWSVASGVGDNCSAFSAALRPAGADPRRFHGPDSPPEDLVWMHLKGAEPTGVNRWKLSLESSDQSESAVGTLVMSEGIEGFIDANFELDAPTGWSLWLPPALFFRRTDQFTHGAGEVFDGVDLMGRTTQIYFQAPAQTTSGLKKACARTLHSDHGKRSLGWKRSVWRHDMGATDRSQMVRAGKSLPCACAWIRLQRTLRLMHGVWVFPLCRQSGSSRPRLGGMS